MNLTPIDPETLPLALATFQSYLAPGTVSAHAFARIAETAADPGAPADTPAHRAAARDLVAGFGLPALDEEPAASFSWDGQAVRTRTEASVLIHEVAHWLIASPERRRLPDFGLGAGPETGSIDAANAVRCVDDRVKENEELLASLLGILFEAHLGHPAIHAFIEQNWLEAWDRPAAGAPFVRAVDMLLARGLIGPDGRPILPQSGNAATAAISIRNSGQASAETSTMADAGPSLGK